AAIERMGFEDVLAVVGDWHEITITLFDHMDMRPKKKAKKTTDKGKDNVVWDFGLTHYQMRKNKA
ncbi:hypothetical protein LCGC14_2414130, partial [marine sediment metagenome]